MREKSSEEASRDGRLTAAAAGFCPAHCRRQGMRKGTSFLEYALLAALVGIVGAAGVMYYGDKIREFFVNLGDKTSEVTPKK